MGSLGGGPTRGRRRARTPAPGRRALTGHGEVVEGRLALLQVLWPLPVAGEGAVILQQEVARPPGLDVLTCGRGGGPEAGPQGPHPSARGSRARPGMHPGPRGWRAAPAVGERPPLMEGPPACAGKGSGGRPDLVEAGPVLGALQELASSAWRPAPHPGLPGRCEPALSGPPGWARGAEAPARVTALLPSGEPGVLS